jgi:hypothetical protein
MSYVAPTELKEIFEAGAINMLLLTELRAIHSFISFVAFFLPALKGANL